MTETLSPVLSDRVEFLTRQLLEKAHDAEVSASYIPRRRAPVWRPPSREQF